MAILQLWENLKEAITVYTGLSPAAFFTILALAVAFYHVVSGLFASPAPPPRARAMEEELPPPVQLGEVTAEELRAYDGSDPKKPLLMAIKGQIYDVSRSRMFYGPGGPYALFAGKDASRALAKMSFEEQDLTGDLEGLGPFELDALQDWEYKFMSKYVKVGTIKKETNTEPESSAADVNAATDTTERSTDAEPSDEIPSVDAKPEEDNAKPRDDDAKPQEDDAEPRDAHAKPKEDASIRHEVQE
ncbi:membrane steroid-binding protein 1-like [Nymphaea colorata]|nr:membrane steroid-binding protein 1-like [Nymphaea colorata]